MCRFTRTSPSKLLGLGRDRVPSVPYTSMKGRSLSQTSKLSCAVPSTPDAKVRTAEACVATSTSTLSAARFGAVSCRTGAPILLAAATVLIGPSRFTRIAT